MATTRYFSANDPEIGVTPAQLRRLGRARQIEYMLYWFESNFEDPAQETPYNGQEGGYLYVRGGPYDASEQLYDEFGRWVTEDRIQEVADQVESEGITDWAPGRNHPDNQRARQEWYEERDEREETDEPTAIETITRQLESGISPTYGSLSEIEERKAILARLDQLDAALVTMQPSHGRIGHNRPPDEEPQSSYLIDAREAAADIRAELIKDTPDAVVVVKAASRLGSAFSWLLKKIDVTVESFAKTLGQAAATAAVASIYFKPGSISAAAEIATDVISMTVSWLQNITLPF